MIDINENLYEIIFKYHLDRYYPHYRNMYEAEKILRDVINNILHNRKKAIFVGNDKNGIAFVRNIVRDYVDIDFIHYKRNDMTLNWLEEVDWKEYDDIYISCRFMARNMLSGGLGYII